jgi:hypothetical protein
MARAINRPVVIGSIEDTRATEDEMVLARLVAAAADHRPADCRLQALRLAGEFRTAGMRGRMGCRPDRACRGSPLQLR